MLVPLWFHMGASLSLADIWWFLLDSRLYVLPTSPMKLKLRPVKPVRMGSPLPPPQSVFHSYISVITG